MVKAPTTGSLAQEFGDKAKQPGEKRQYHLGKKIYFEREVRAKVVQPPLQEKTREPRKPGAQHTEKRGGQPPHPSPEERKKAKDRQKEKAIEVRDEERKEEEEFGRVNPSLPQLINQAEEVESVLSVLDDQHREALGKLKKGFRRAKGDKERNEILLRRLQLQEDGLQEARHGIHVLTDLVRCLALQQQQQRQQQPQQQQKPGREEAE